jgi:hypothetical protein
VAHSVSNLQSRRCDGGKRATFASFPFMNDNCTKIGDLAPIVSYSQNLTNTELRKLPRDSSEAVPSVCYDETTLSRTNMGLARMWLD